MQMANGGATGGSGGGLLLLTKPGTINLRQKTLLPLKNSNFYSRFTLQKPYISIITTRYSHRKDSSAKTVWSQKFKFKFRDKNKRTREKDGFDGQEEVETSRRKRKKRRWWSDKPPVMQEEEAYGIFEEYLDSLWILEVFKSYGWALPPIIVSWLIASGPKAFLVTLALPLGQSVISFVFNKLWGRIKSKPKHKARKRRKPFVSSPSDAENETEEERQESVKGKKGIRSWIGNDNGSINIESQEAPYYGGWDELDEMESKQRQPRRAGQSQRTLSMSGQLGKRERKSDAPLLLRLLIAVFPFLDSWTKML
eukprot:XP_015574061.1 uncharacterized protein LOC8265692 [Ricinus communis]